MESAVRTARPADFTVCPVTLAQDKLRSILQGIMPMFQQPLDSVQEFWLPTRSNALLRLDQFLNSVPKYAEMRNYDLGPESVVSRLSPWLRHRMITEKEVIAAVSARYPLNTVQKFVDEVCWRTYWKGFLEQHPAVWSVFKRQRISGPSELSAEQYQRYRKAQNSDTGIEAFDAWNAELIQSGYLHNHARMWYASIWIFTLQLPWALGADWFHRHLLDGDAASNTLSWRWVAGLHTKGKHYLARAENIRTYTRGTFSPVGQLNEFAEALSEQEPIPSVALRHCEDDSSARLPSLSCCPGGLLLTDDDLSPEFSGLSEVPFNAIACFQSKEVYREFRFSEPVIQFKEGAMQDAMRRASAHWNLSAHSATCENWVASVCKWATQEHLKAVRILRPTVGPWRDRLPALKSALIRHGIQLLEHRRSWDSLHWPHASKGFFKFKQGLEHRLIPVNR